MKPKAIIKHGSNTLTQTLATLIDINPTPGFPMWLRIDYSATGTQSDDVEYAVLFNNVTVLQQLAASIGEIGFRGSVAAILVPPNARVRVQMRNVIQATGTGRILVSLVETDFELVGEEFLKARGAGVGGRETA